ncbi:MAG TPA: FAD-dependent oxidoreductase [Gemmatimonadales bacterium]|nr:FAD-dependent oxidoreductase [Gemmatimonadales bacterium]
MDLLVLGGGIVGAGVARDAALRGLRVTLLEQRTVGWGTSSRSSRLIHGGIRYLELGDFALVREALHERAVLLRIAPGLVRPTPFLFTMDRGEYWQWLKVGVGVAMYRALAGRHALGPHRPLTRRAMVKREPLLADSPILGGALYQDARGDDIGLVWANIAAAQAAGATIIEHMTAMVQVDDTGVTATLPSGRRIRASALVLAMGPWTDEGRAGIGLPDLDLVGGTKGVHITFSLDRLPLGYAVTMRHPDDNRVMFCIPEPENGRVLVGTTDTATDEPPEALTVGDDDIDYLIRALRHLFPRRDLTPGDIRDRWAGVRPLLQQKGTESSRSREHLILREGRCLTIAGGKLTTYRAMAEEAVDMLGDVLGRELPRSTTAETIL